MHIFSLKDLSIHVHAAGMLTPTLAQIKLDEKSLVGGEKREEKNTFVTSNFKSLAEHCAFEVLIWTRQKINGGFLIRIGVFMLGCFYSTISNKWSLWLCSQPSVYTTQLKFD